jgi:hypothetical protein
MKTSSIIPSEMTDKELRVICGHLFTARNWGQNNYVVTLPNGLGYMVNVKNQIDYNNEITKRTNEKSN